MKKELISTLESLTIFFPFFNDEGTVEMQIDNAYDTGLKHTNNLEVIAINGGKSQDNTFEKILFMKEKHPDLIVIDKNDNKEGYAVIKYGFEQATKAWVFYTDGDAQYRIGEDLHKLIHKMYKTRADAINGYKKHRGDSFVRVFLGNCYKRVSRRVFKLPIRDTDCDFRLIKNSHLKKITLESTDASILPELIKKLEQIGTKFAEVEVSHYRRIYGKSNYTAWSLLKEKVIGDIKLYIKMKKYRHL